MNSSPRRSHRHAVQARAHGRVCSATGRVPGTGEPHQSHDCPPALVRRPADCAVATWKLARVVHARRRPRRRQSVVLPMPAAAHRSRGCSSRDRQCCRWTDRRGHGAMSPGGPPMAEPSPCGPLIDPTGLHRPRRRGWACDDRPGESDAPAGRDSHRMRRAPRRALAVTGVSVVFLAGCSGTTPDPSVRRSPAARRRARRAAAHHRRDRLPDRPAGAQRDRRPRDLLGRGLPAFLPRGVPTPRRRLLLRRQLRPRRAQVPTQRHRLPGTPAGPGGSGRERPLQPPLRRHRLRPVAVAGSRRHLRALAARRRAGPRVRPCRPGTCRLRGRRPEHPGRDAGRLLRRSLDGLGQRRRGEARGDRRAGPRRRPARLPPAP